MFGSPKQQPPKKTKKSSPAKDTAVTILTSGCHFSGKLYCRGSSRIGGKIEGEIISEGLLIIEEEAQIQAEIKAEEAIIQGTVHGTIEANGRVELNASSKFHGDIISPVLVINEGAQFNGRSAMKAPNTGDKEIKIDSKSGKNVERLSGKKGPSADPGNIKDVKHPDVAVMKVPEVSPT